MDTSRDAFEEAAFGGDDAGALETEWRFSSELGEEELVAVVREALPRDVILLRRIPRVITDIYCDTPDERLLRSGSSLRFRRMRASGGWSIGFKKPAGETGGLPTRFELLSKLKKSEAAAVLAGNATAPAWAAAVAYADLEGNAKAFGARLVVTSLRRSYSVQPRDGNDRWQHFLLSLFFEDVAAASLAGVDAVRFIRTGMQDVTTGSLPAVSIASGELEAQGSTLGAEGEARGLALARETASLLEDGSYARHEPRTKYELAAALLERDLFGRTA